MASLPKRLKISESDDDSVSNDSASHVSALLNGLGRLKETELFCDVTVRVRDREFKAHKCILTIFSDFWKAMLSSPMKERSQDTITLKDSDNITAEAFENILHYFYTGELRLTANNVAEIFKASSVMCIVPLAKKCVRFITDMFIRDQHKQRHEEREIELEDYVSYYEMSNTFSVPDLREYMLKAIAQNFSLVCDTEEFLRTASFELIDTILDRNDIATLSELQILQRLTAWIEADVTSRRKHVPALAKKLRLGLIPIADVDRALNESAFVRDFPEVQKTYQELLRYYALGKQLSYVERNPKMFTPRPCRKTLVAVSTEKILKYYDADQGKWIQRQSVPWSGSPAAVVACNCIFVGGGKWRQSASDFVCYNIGNSSWETLPRMLTGRHQFSMVYLDGYIYAIGGMENDAVLASVERFSLTSRSWQKVSSLNQARHLFCSVVKGGCIYVIGGQASQDAKPKETGKKPESCGGLDVRGMFSGEMCSPMKVERFVPSLNKWEICGRSMDHIEATAVVIDGQICVGGGGLIADNGEEIRPCEILNITEDGAPRTVQAELANETPTQNLIPVTKPNPTFFQIANNVRLFRVGKRVFFNLNGFCYESELVIGDDQVYELELGKWENIFRECVDNSCFAIVSADINILEGLPS